MKQGEKTKTRILKGASKLFYEKGFANAAISDIVDET